jgi:uncharacterized membrane protein YkoI
MKTILTTSTSLIVLLAVVLVGFNNNNINNDIGNAFAQMDLEDSQMMEDGMKMNDTSMTMSNQSEGMKILNLNGTIDVESTIAEALKSKITTDIIGAIQAAQASVGANSFVKKAELTHAHGYLVYKMMVVDENMKKYKVIVDPGNGQVLMKKEVTWYDEHKMKYGRDEEKYDKYGHDDNDYDKMMMMKDKKY